MEEKKNEVKHWKFNICDEERDIWATEKDLEVYANVVIETRRAEGENLYLALQKSMAKLLYFVTAFKRLYSRNAKKSTLYVEY